MYPARAMYDDPPRDRRVATPVGLAVSLLLATDGLNSMEHQISFTHMVYILVYPSITCISFSMLSQPLSRSQVGLSHGLGDAFHRAALRQLDRRVEADTMADGDDDRLEVSISWLGRSKSGAPGGAGQTYEQGVIMTAHQLSGGRRTQGGKRMLVETIHVVQLLADAYGWDPTHDTQVRC